MMRCEGWTRHGGAFTLGPVTWTQCENEAEVLLKGTQEDGEKFEQPACMGCWKKAKGIDHIKIKSAEPLLTTPEGDR